MSAIAHGWHPAHAAHKLPPLAVAQEFHMADKKKGEFEHPAHHATGGPLGNEVTFAKGGPAGYNGFYGGGPYDRQAMFYGGGTTGNTVYFGEGGKVENISRVLDFLVHGKDALMDRIEGAFSNPYTADPEELRGLISKYWHLQSPEKISPAAVTTPPGHASGGSVKSDGIMDSITSALDRAAIGLLSQVQGEKNGKAAWTTDPGLVEEAKAMPYYMSSLGHSAVGIAAPLMAAATHGMGLSDVPLLGAGADLLGLGKGALDSLWQRYHGNPAPAWSHAAADKANAITRAVEASQGKGDPHGFLDNAAQMGGTLLGQIPLLDMGAGADAAEDAGRLNGLTRLLGNDILEWTTPAIRPSLTNYTSGALLGGLAGLGGNTADRSSP